MRKPPTDRKRPEGPPEGGSPESPDEMSEAVGNKAARIIKAQQEKPHELWFGLGMFGLIGWSVSVPSLLALALGLWIDRRWPGPVSWGLTLLFAGVVLGCWNAWYWLNRHGNS